MAESVLEKLKKIMLVADRMRQDQMRRILCLDYKDFDNALLDWALQFRFRIDGEDVVFAGGDVEGFIGELDKSFSQWNRSGNGKAKAVSVPPVFTPPPIARPAPMPPETTPGQSQQGSAKPPENYMRMQANLLALQGSEERRREGKWRLQKLQVKDALAHCEFQEVKDQVYGLLKTQGSFTNDAKQTFWEILRAEEAECLKQIPPATNNVILKILLVGGPAVGKTTFLLKFLKDEFVTDVSETRSVDIYAKKITHKNGDITCLFYDFGANFYFSEIKDLWSAIVTGAHGAILFYDPTRMNSLDNMEEWVNLCRAQDKTLPVLLCDTKIDLESDRSVAVDYAGSFLQPLSLLDCYETSAKTGADVTAAVDALVREILKALI